MLGSFVSQVFSPAQPPQKLSLDLASAMNNGHFELKESLAFALNSGILENTNSMSMSELRDSNPVKAGKPSRGKTLFGFL